MIVVIVIVVVVLILLLFFWLGYNGLVKRRNRVDNAWSQIDVQLKRRHDLIPNLVETVKGYAAHERGTFEAVTDGPRQRDQRAEAPSRPGPGRERAERRAEEPVRGGRGLPRPQGEPELPATCRKSSPSTEDRIAYARQFYNDSVLELQHQDPDSSPR